MILNLLSVMAKKAAQTLEVTKLAVLAYEGYVSVSDVVECVMSGFEVHVAGGVFDVCVPCDKEQAEKVVSHTNGRCVYLAERNLVICPMGQVLYPGNYTKTTRDVAFYNSVVCRRCVCRCTTSGLGVFLLLCEITVLVKCIIQRVCLLGRLG